MNTALKVRSSKVSMLSGFADGGVPTVDGAVERGRSGADTAGVIFIRLPSGFCGVDATGDGAVGDLVDDCWVGSGDREGEGLEEFGGESEEPSALDAAGTGFASLARRLLRI